MSCYAIGALNCCKVGPTCFGITCTRGWQISRVRDHGQVFEAAVISGYLADRGLNLPSCDVECLREVRDQITNVFDANGQTDKVIRKSALL